MLASGNKSYGIEAILLNEGNVQYRICELEKANDVIKINWLKEVSLADDIKPLIKKDFPVTLVVSGKGMLFKSVGDIKNPTILQFFPGINISDFYSAIVPYRNTSLGYLIRKKSVDEIVEKIFNLGLNVISVTFGTGVAISTFNAIEDNIALSKVVIHNNEFIFGSDSNTNGEASTLNEISIGGERLPVAYLLAYSAAISYYLGYEDNSVINSRITENSRQFKTNTLITRYSLIFLSVVLGLILISTGANYYYSQQLNDLSLTVPAYANNEMRDSLIVQINSKKKFLVEGDWLASSQSSFYADRIAASIPQGVKLIALNIFPKANLLGEGDEDALNFNNDELVIKGIARDELVLKNWIENVRSNKWISSISVNNYQWNSKTNEGEFEVKIGLK
ncbi:MAG: hypothetical protein JST49_15585 [Bacteroidetes bacterium]|nr:hypothetical protein [Bacteroidota bacterium]